MRVLPSVLRATIDRLRSVEHSYKTLRDIDTSSLSVRSLTSDALFDLASAEVQGCVNYSSHPDMLFVFAKEFGTNTIVYVLSYAVADEADIPGIPSIRSRELRSSVEKKLAKHSEYTRWVKDAKFGWVSVGTIAFEPYFSHELLFTPHVSLATRARGKGIAVSLYSMFMNTGRILVTEGHTKAAEKLWDRLATTGFKQRWYRAAKESWVDPKSSNSIRVLFAPSKFKEDRVLKLLIENS